MERLKTVTVAQLTVGGKHSVRTGSLLYRSCLRFEMEFGLDVVWQWFAVGLQHSRTIAYTNTRDSPVRVQYSNRPMPSGVIFYNTL